MHTKGTSIIPLSTVLENLKEIAGTSFLTRQEYDDTPNKIYSFSYINKTFGFTWNTLLEKAGLKQKRKWGGLITQGRKSKNTTKSKVVTCLLCDRLFNSFDPTLNRICKKCKIRVQLEDGWDE